MLELPEVLTISDQLQKTITGKIIGRTLPPTKEHRFCWFNGDPADYNDILTGQKVMTVKGFGIFVEISFEEGHKLCFNDGVNVRFLRVEDVPKNYQLTIEFEDGMALAFTVAMYGGVILHKDDYDNEYYVKSTKAVSPFSPEFEPYFYRLMAESKPTLSAKAFLATGQNFPGIGNGVLQDILFGARIHPKRKLGSFNDEDKSRLMACTISVLSDMTERGGRDTEKDLFGNPGAYETQMSKNTWTSACTACGGPITKEAYLGGSVYYCPACQPK